MQFSYQQSYTSFQGTYGSIINWPIPYQYTNWYFSLPEQHQEYYLNPTNYSLLYSWARQYQQSQKKQQKPIKLSRSQKRKQKKKALQQQYKKQEGLIGKWVLKQRKDLVNQLKKIQEQQIKIKQKKQQKFNYLIQIHKQVYKHHMKKKNQNHTNKRSNPKNSKNKKKMSIIKKMKQIFQAKRDKTETSDKDKNNKNEQKKQKSEQKKQQKSKNLNSSLEQNEHDSDYEDISEDDDLQNKQKQQKTKQQKQPKIPNVSFDIKQIEYKNIGKLAGKSYCDMNLRQWVTNVPNPQLQQLTLKLVNRLAYKQAIKKVNKPQKAKKLIVSGIKQCKRTLTTILDNKKSKCLIVALNIQRNNLIKGTDDQVQKCITLSQQLKIPIIHISTRSKLGRAFTGKFGPRITVISVVNYQGYQDMMEILLQSWHKSCKDYDNIL